MNQNKMKKKSMIRIVATIMLLLLFNPSFSQTDTTAEALDEVVITAQRIKQKELLSPYSIRSIGQSYFKEMSPRTVPEALTGINGVFVQKTNHGGGSPFIRGLTGNQTLILVDGIRLNNSTFRYGPNQYLNTIDGYMINRIEVAKGTGSVQYGTDGLGGVIHVITRDPEFITGKPAVHGRVLAKYMTGDMERTVRGDISYSTNSSGFTGGITYRKFGDLIGGDTTGKQTPSGYDEFSFDAKAKFALKENMQLTIAHQFLQQQHVPVYHKIVLENFAINEFDPQRRLLSYARLNWQGKSNWIRKTEIIASWQKSAESRRMKKNGSNILRLEEDNSSTIGLTSDIFSEVNKWWTANSGIELYFDKVNSKRHDIDTQNGITESKRGLYPDNSFYGNYSVYSIHHLNFNKWIVDAGLRFNVFNVRISDSTLGKVGISPSALVVNAAVMYNITGSHHVYVAYSSGYRAPNVDDMGTLGIVDFRYEIPAAGLSPEKSQNIEIGYKARGKSLGARLAVYYMNLDDLITRVKVDGQSISGYPVYKKENVEEAYIKGFEAEVDWQIIRSLRVTGGLTYTYGKNNTKKEPLRRIPPLNGRVLANWHIKKFSASAELLFASKQDRLAQGDKEDNRIPAGGTPGWRVMNFYTGYRISFFGINAGVQNLFNRDYRTHGSGINGVGRSGWLSVVFNF
jgi:hemoglobin/transferrin/lactoferrin receptor protein